jgi:chemotaxis protein CheZ
MNHENLKTIELDPPLLTCLDQARRLVTLLETGRVDEAGPVLNDLCRVRETDLFRNIGRLTRDLHETLNSLSGDDHLHLLMKEQMPEARASLDYVIKTTEKSAHQTLTAVENCAQVIERLTSGAAELQSLLQDATTQQHQQTLATRADSFIAAVIGDAQQLRANMNDVLMAQGFQDITGQVIQQVISMVQELEKSLVDILRVSSRHIDGAADDTAEQIIQANGPAIPGVTRGEVMQNQDDVDELLATLGF